MTNDSRFCCPLSLKGFVLAPSIILAEKSKVFCKTSSHHKLLEGENIKIKNLPQGKVFILNGTNSPFVQPQPATTLIHRTNYNLCCCSSGPVHYYYDNCFQGKVFHLFNPQRLCNSYMRHSLTITVQNVQTPNFKWWFKRLKQEGFGAEVERILVLIAVAFEQDMRVTEVLEISVSGCRGLHLTLNFIDASTLSGWLILIICAWGGLPHALFRHWLCGNVGIHR